MLRQHFDGLGLADAGVDVGLQAFEELAKHYLVARVGVDEARDALDLALGDFGHVVGPLLPIAPITYFLYHASKNSPLQFTELHGHLATVDGFGFACFA